MQESDSFQQVQCVIEGRLWTYKRGDADSAFFYARAKFPPQKGYKIFSTKCKDQAKANVVATNRYYELAGRASLNINVKTDSLVTLMKEYLDYKDRLRNRSEDHQTKYRDIYDRFIKDHFGQTKVTDLHKINQGDMQDYWTYRTTYWKNRAKSPQMIKSRYGNNRAKFMNAHRMAGREVGYYTLMIEVQLFRSFFKWAVSRGYLLAQNVPDVVNPVPKVDKETANLRGVFTDGEYTIIQKHVRHDADSRAGDDLFDGEPQFSIWKDVERFRAERMYCFFFTAAAFGLRPMELKNLTFDMVKLLKCPKSGNYFSVIDLPAHLAKKNPDGSAKGRRVYSFDNELAYNRIHVRWKNYLQWFHDETIDESRMYIFPKWTRVKDRFPEADSQYTKPGPKAEDYESVMYGPAARMDTAFRAMLKKLKKEDGTPMHRDSDGRPRSTYSLRKFYITQRIRHNTPLPALAINTGHDIQTMWRWYQHISTDDMAEYLTKRDPSQFAKELQQVPGVVE